MCRKVDILTIGADVYIPLVFRDVETVLSALIEKAESENEELSTEDMFAVYRQIREAWNLHRQITRKYLNLLISQLTSGNFHSVFNPSSPQQS